MNNIKPQIVIFTGEISSSIIKDITAGLEEEGVFYAVVKAQEKLNAHELSIIAAETGTLGTGIGASNNEICIHNVKLPKDKPIFRVSADGEENARTLGANAARLVKGKPFKFYE
jgi:hypothetical protein